LDGEESVGVHLLTDAFKEDRQVVMVIELLDLDLPLDFILRSVLNGDGKITSVVEKSKFRNRDLSGNNGTSFRLLDFRLGSAHQKRGALST
jgi:hypothetical protein